MQKFGGRHIVPACQESVNPRSIERSRLLSYSWKEAHKIGPVMDSFVSEVQGLMCIEIQVPTESLIGGFWVQARRVTQLARQTGNFEPDIEVMEGVFVKESTTVTPSQSVNSRLCFGRPNAALSQIPPPTPTNRLHPGQPETARPCIWRLIALRVSSLN